MTGSSSGLSGEVVIRDRRASFALRAAVGAVALALAYYLGARLGMVLRFPNSTPSVLWPPNALLTAALLLSPPRWWWLLLAAALPPHLVVELGSGWSPGIVLALYFTNCFEALLAAGGVYWLTGRRGRFDTVSRTIAFLAAAVVVAPFLSSFPDAGFVSVFHGEPFWKVWSTRCLSNAIAALTIVPAFVLTLRDGRGWIRNSTAAQRVEASLLAASLIAVTLVAFSLSGVEAAFAALPIQDPLVLTLPVLLWAAVRFGSGGLSLAMLFTTVVAISSGIHGEGPFAAMPPESGVLSLQLFLFAAGIPLLTLASASEERRSALAAVEERLRFEELLGDLAKAFVDLPIEKIDDSLDLWAHLLAGFFGADRGVLLLRAPTREGGARVEGSSSSSPETLARDSEIETLPWSAAQLSQDMVVLVERPEALPDEAREDAAWLRRQESRSAFFIPLCTPGRFIGALALVRRKRGAWPADSTLRGRLVAEVMVSALARREHELARRAAEELERGILASLPNQVAILGRDGRILSVNEVWRRDFRAEKANPLMAPQVGADYVQACRDAEISGVPGSTGAAAGILAVLEGRQPSYQSEYCHRALPEEGWFALSVTPLRGEVGGAVVSHTDITRLKRSEFQLQESRQELAYYNRISAIGELTASLAHELNQPLTGILLNLRVAQQSLAQPAAAERDQGLAGILEDLVEDARRASTVMRRSRELLSRRPALDARLDLHQEIRVVQRLIGPDAMRRDVAVRLDLSPESAAVLGDRIQLQQVLLNLLLNALDASAGTPDAAVVLRSRVLGDEVEVAVEDNGSGIEPAVVSSLFDPFFSTKPNGMGMGLSICRTILAGHGGTIRALNNAERGARFEFRLPLAGAAPEAPD